MGPRAVSRKTLAARARIAGLKATESVCPYCAVGCGQVVYTHEGELVDIEGNPRSPINQGTLCQKGSASRQLVQRPGRLTDGPVRPGGTEWEDLPLETAMDMIADHARPGRLQAKLANPVVDRSPGAASRGAGRCAEDFAREPHVALALRVFPRGSVATRARSENAHRGWVEVECLDARVLEAGV
jgi:anaerobic selenocysteine-containing dehydrogenase